MSTKPSIWITGASSGIGAAFAHEAARAGYRVALTARRKDALEREAEKIRALPGVEPDDVCVLPGDVSNADAMKGCAQAALGRFGTVDILVANAGTSTLEAPENLDTESCKKLFEINFFGVLRCIDAILPEMLARKRGQIVAVSSVAGYRGLPRAAAYCSTKAALTSYLESLRFDVEPRGITVTIVSPGFVKTPLTDKNDFSMPFLITPEVAARAMLRGIERKSYEVHFPKVFTTIMKLFRILPYPLYHAIVRLQTKGNVGGR